MGVAGKSASCPACGNVFTVPPFATAVASPASAADPFAFLDVDDQQVSRPPTRRPASSGVEMAVALGLTVFLAAAFLLALMSRREADGGSSAWLFVLTPTVVVIILIGTILGVLLYALPSIIAYKRQHPNFPAILALNLLLGWAFVGWVGALVWALTAVESKVHHHYHR